jgi:hypothetical protein
MRKLPFGSLNHAKPNFGNPFATFISLRPKLVVAVLLNVTVPVAAEGDKEAVSNTLLPWTGPIEEAVRVTLEAIADASAKNFKLKVAAPVALLASVTVTVWVAAVLVPVGVPVIAPAPEAMLSPDVSAGETLYVSGDAPPEPATGVNEAAAAILVSVFEAMACVAVGSAKTLIFN